MRSDYILERQIPLVLAALTPQNRLVMRLALHTGLRVSDVLSIPAAKLGPRVGVTERKTGKKKVIGIPAPLLAEIRAGAGQIWAFPGRDPEKPRTRQAVWWDVKRACRAFRVSQNVTPHSARKVYAVRLLQKYGDLERVRRALNHGDVATTMIYAMADRLAGLDLSN